jgi:hypothetical protein
LFYVNGHYYEGVPMCFLSKYLLIAFLLLGSWSSQADVKFVADPYLGWSFGSFNSKLFSSTGGKCTTFNGLNPGSVVGQVQ